jgi:hypothetical protein
MAKRPSIDIRSELAPCVGRPHPQFRDSDIEHLVHCLAQLKRETWNEAARQRWSARLKEARAAKKTVSDALTILQQAGTPQVVIAAMLEFIAARDADIEWFQEFLGRGTKVRQPWSIMAWIIGRFTLKALRGADELAAV